MQKDERPVGRISSRFHSFRQTNGRQKNGAQVRCKGIFFCPLFSCRTSSQICPCVRLGRRPADPAGRLPRCVPRDLPRDRQTDDPGKTGGGGRSTVLRDQRQSDRDGPALCQDRRAGSVHGLDLRHARRAPAGEYQVSVSWKGSLRGISPDQRDAMPERLPPRYGDAAASGIQVRVTPGDNRLETIDLAP